MTTSKRPSDLLEALRTRVAQLRLIAAPPSIARVDGLTVQVTDIRWHKGRPEYRFTLPARAYESVGRLRFALVKAGFTTVDGLPGVWVLRARS